MTTFTHPQSKQQISTETIARLIDGMRTSTSQRQRAELRRELYRVGTLLSEIIADLEHRLERGDAVLAARYDVAKEDRWLAWRKTYEAACDARSLVEFRGLADAPARITQRRELDEAA